jgi:hypothetical protein
MLSRHEQQQLAEIERQFTASDPALAGLLSKGPSSARTRRRKLAVLAVSLLGALLILLGAAVATFSLIFFGVVALLTCAGVHVWNHRADEP